MIAESRCVVCKLPIRFRGRKPHRCSPGELARSYVRDLLLPTGTEIPRTREDLARVLLSTWLDGFEMASMLGPLTDVNLRTMCVGDIPRKYGPKSAPRLA